MRQKPPKRCYVLNEASAFRDIREGVLQAGRCLFTILCIFLCCLDRLDHFLSIIHLDVCAILNVLDIFLIGHVFFTRVN